MSRLCTSRGRSPTSTSTFFCFRREYLELKILLPLSLAYSFVYLGYYGYTTIPGFHSFPSSPSFPSPIFPLLTINSIPVVFSGEILPLETLIDLFHFSALPQTPSVRLIVVCVLGTLPRTDWTPTSPLIVPRGGCLYGLL